MRRVFALAALICACGLLSAAEGRRSVPPGRTTTTTPTPTTTAHDAQDDDRGFHPAEITKPRLIERQDSRHFDGHYEYRYVLSNGDTRYERAYWLPVGKSMVLARKGYYSYPLPNKDFLTVFYTADNNGYHQDSSKFTKLQPLLPRSLDVPQHDAPVLPSPTTVRPPRRSTTTRRHRRTTKAPITNLRVLAELQEATTKTPVTGAAPEQDMQTTTSEVNVDVNVEGELLTTTTTEAARPAVDTSSKDESDSASISQSENESNSVDEEQDGSPTTSTWTVGASAARH